MYENTPYAAEGQQIARRKALLDAMTQQAISPRQTQMVSGRVVPGGIGQGMTQLAQALMAKKGLASVSEQEKALAGKMESGRSEAVNRVIETMSGKPQTGGPLRGASEYQPVQPAVPGDPAKAAMMAATDPHLRGDKGFQNVSSAMLKSKQGGSSSPYFQFLPTAEGYKVGNARTGDISSPEQSFVRSTDDPSLQGDIAGSKEQSTKNVQLAMNPQIAAATDTAKAAAEKRRNMAGINNLIETASTILSSGKPTGSGVGTAYDYMAGVFGFSPEGATEAAQLKALGGALTSKMPRMEGPQSDRDTAMYREMAGKVGDSNIPRKERLAALKIVSDIWGKYEELNRDAVQPEQEAETLFQQADAIIGL